jgi:hypothetical protein
MAFHGEGREAVDGRVKPGQDTSHDTSPDTSIERVVRNGA